jgi:dihydrofolate synthase/folylpolyglutamate synthase
MIDALMHTLGYRTGRFTSPHLESFTERISINGESISPEGMIAAYNDIALYLDLVLDFSKQPHPISFFEAITALAFVAFAEFPVDIGIIEVGMGGRMGKRRMLSRVRSRLSRPLALITWNISGKRLKRLR